MKKTILLIFTLVVIYTVGLISFFEYKEKNKEITIGKDKINGMISVMVENENGKYERSTSSRWPSGEYELNKNLSKCENGSELKYDKKTKKVTMSTSKTDRCYLYFDITGTETNPYKIETIEDLVNLSNDVNSENTYAGKYIVLTRDLDFNDPNSYEDSERMDYEDYNEDNNKESLLTELTTGSGFKPIGNKTYSFQGIFDGQNHILKNLYIENSKLVNDNIGLFGTINNSKISNLKVSGKIYTKVNANTGLIGSTYASTIENVQFGFENEKDESFVKSDTNGCSVGGIVGAVYTVTTINNSKNYGDISNSANAGGIIGYTAPNIQVNINNCYNYGQIDNVKNSIIGGIVGRNNGTINIKNSGNEGNVIANADNLGLHMGGIIGRNYGDATIDDSYNTGNIINETQIYDTNVYTSFNLGMGGIIGNNSSNEGKIVKINNTYNLGDVTGGMRMGGIIGYNTNSSVAILNKVFNRGNITNINKTWQSGFNIGGIVGYNNNNSDIYVLNSYNTYVTNPETKANITGHKNAASGIVGASNKIGVVINCYNKGNITKTSGSSYGIMYYSDNSYINNVYNIGNINGSAGSYGIGYYDKTDINEYIVNNAYYLDNVDIGSIIDEIEVGTKLTEQQMNGSEQFNGQNFVDILNSNITSAETEMKEKFPILEGYTLSKWTLGPDGYPTLVNE